MTKRAAIDEVHLKFANDVTKKQVGEIFDALFIAAGAGLGEGERLAWPGFGTFTVRTTAARKGRNPQTGAEIDIPAGQSVRFKPAAELKTKLG